MNEVENIGNCCVCAVVMYAPVGFCKNRRDNNRIFYCLNGHPQSYKASELDRLRSRLVQAEERERAVASEKERLAAKVTRLQRAVKKAKASR